MPWLGVDQRIPRDIRDECRVILSSIRASLRDLLFHELKNTYIPDNYLQTRKTIFTSFVYLTI